MEILIFSLGIAFAVVIAVAIVAVVAFVKVNRAEKQINNNQTSVSREVEDTHRAFHEEVQNIYRRIDDLERHVFSTMDSRFDKLENKLSANSKQILKG